MNNTTSNSADLKNHDDYDSKEDLSPPPRPTAMAASLPVEENPTMRSMAIGARPTIVRKIPHEYRKTSSSTDAEISNDEINIEDYLPGKKVADDSSSTSSTERSNWKVRDGNIRPVPHFYPLEKSSRIVYSIGASMIAARISDCLRAMSVAAQYDDDLATALLKTPEHVEMYVHLFQGKQPKFADGIIVEVQRRRGCSVLFHKYSRCVLDAAEGNWDEDGFENSFSPQTTLNPDLETEDKAEKHENVLLALEIAGGLIKKDRIDANRLGMESLCLLTDPKKTGVYTAAIASRVVLLGTVGSEEDGDLDESHFSIREAVLSLVQRRRLNEDSTFEEDDLHPEEKEHMDLLHNLALVVLANALDDIANSSFSENDSDTTNTLLNDSKLEDGKDLVSTLIESLKLAETHPHDAFLSAKCLRVLIETSSEARERARDLNVLTVVNKAKAIGRESHALLARETESVFAAFNLHD